MSRSLLSFLLFLAVLAVGALLAGWWVGPAMISLAFDDDRRSTPYYLIHLVDGETPPGYFQTFAELLREDEGQLLWRGSQSALHVGRSSDEIAEAALIEFSQGGGVVQMMTSSAYRDLTGTAEPVLLGTQTAPGPIAQDEILILWLLETAEDASAESLQSLSASAGMFDGQLIWSTPIDRLASARRWNHVLLLAFPSPAAVQDWLRDPQTATDRALARRFYVDEAMLELWAG